jgi:hypothetical protein
MPTFLFALATILAGYVIQALTQPAPTKPSPAAFEDFEFPQMEEGTPQSVVFGDTWTEDWMVGYYGNYRTSEVKSSQAGK